MCKLDNHFKINHYRYCCFKIKTFKLKNGVRSITEIPPRIISASKNLSWRMYILKI